MEKILRLEIFDVILFESDAQAWLKKCNEDKREWILKHSSQRDETQITEFINNPNISKECKCLDCGKNKKDESNRISKEVTAIIEPVSNSGDNGKNSTKRSKAIKGRKG